MAIRNYGPLVMVHRPGGGYNAFRGFAGTPGGAELIASIAGAINQGRGYIPSAHDIEYWDGQINQYGWDQAAATLRQIVINQGGTPGPAPVVATPPIVVTPPVILPTPTPTPTPAPTPSGGGLLEGNITLPVIGTISKKTALIGGAILAFFLMEK